MRISNDKGDLRKKEDKLRQGERNLHQKRGQLHQKILVLDKEAFSLKLTIK